MYNMSIKEGEDYSTLEKGIVILISDYELESLKEIEKYITKWNIREEVSKNYLDRCNGNLYN